MVEPETKAPKPFASDENAKDERARIIASRNTVTALALVFMVVLFFAITIVKMKI